MWPSNSTQKCMLQIHLIFPQWSTWKVSPYSIITFACFTYLEMTLYDCTVVQLFLGTVWIFTFKYIIHVCMIWNEHPFWWSNFISKTGPLKIIKIYTEDKYRSSYTPYTISSVLERLCLLSSQLDPQCLAQQWHRVALNNIYLMDEWMYTYKGSYARMSTSVFSSLWTVEILNSHLQKAV